VKGAIELAVAGALEALVRCHLPGVRWDRGCPSEHGESRLGADPSRMRPRAEHGGSPNKPGNDGRSLQWNNNESMSGSTCTAAGR
jgi:hypothetical protein